MWGICLDSDTMQEGLFQKVIQYRIDENDEVVITLPKTTTKPNRKHIRELSVPPKYIYGERVSPYNHPDIIGVICDIHWHFKLNCCFYKIKVKGKSPLPMTGGQKWKIKSKRYFDDDLSKLPPPTKQI